MNSNKLTLNKKDFYIIIDEETNNIFYYQKNCGSLVIRKKMNTDKYYVYNKSSFVLDETIYTFVNYYFLYEATAYEITWCNKIDDLDLSYEWVEY